jgi:CRISPR system Cascade subunit CasE
MIKMGKKYGKGRRQVWHAVQFDGVLTVTDAAEFADGIRGGIGSAKAFGFGLLSIPYADN